MVTVQAPVPEQAPLQPAKVDPAAAAAVKVTCVGSVYSASHVGPQSIPAGEPVTVPEPPPAFVTESVYSASVTVKQPENSDVLPAGSVAVAVITSPTGTSSTVRENVPIPSAWVATAKCARNVVPWPFPDGSHKGLAKSSTVNPVSGVSSRLPSTTVVPLCVSVVAEVTTGKFCRPFGPVSPSPSSFGVTPSSPRSMPSTALSWIEFAKIESPLPEMTSTPWSRLKAIVLAAPASVPPTSLFDPAT